jgi:HEAT repeat protein
MIANAAFAAWLADRDSQLRSSASVDALGAQWSNEPLIRETAHALASLPERNAGAVAEVARGFLDRTGDVERMIEDLLAASRRDPFFRPPLLPIIRETYAALVLFDHPDLMVALGVTGADTVAATRAARRGAASISFAGTTLIYRFVKAGDAILSFWEAPPITDGFVGAEAGKCRMVGRRRIEDGERMELDGRRQSFVIEHVERDMVFLHAEVLADPAPLVAEYDSTTLALVGASSADQASSRVQMMVSLLRALGRDDAAPLIEEAIAGAPFYARWHIMRELLAMDAEAALPPLRRMAAGDPHPEVRAAAARTLDMFFDGEEVRCRA